MDPIKLMVECTSESPCVMPGSETIAANPAGLIVISIGLFVAVLGLITMIIGYRLAYYP